MERELKTAQEVIKNASFNGAKRASRLHLSGADFASLDVVDTQFHNCNFTCVSFIHAHLSNVAFHDCTMDGVDFSKSNLEGCSFNSCSIRNARYDNAKISTTFFNKCKMESSVFHGATIYCTHFIGSSVSLSDFTGATLDGGRYKTTQFDYCKFGLAQICAVTFEECDLRGIEIKGANIKLADLERCHLPNCLMAFEGILPEEHGAIFYDKANKQVFNKRTMFGMDGLIDKYNRGHKYSNGKVFNRLLALKQFIATQK